MNVPLQLRQNGIEPEELSGFKTDAKYIAIDLETRDPDLKIVRFWSCTMVMVRVVGFAVAVPWMVNGYFPIAHEGGRTQYG
jgi:hypothetical protein